MGYIYPRETLSAPQTDLETHTVNIVICTVSILSALGAGWIMASYVLFPKFRSFRHQLILGLAASDFLMAINFLTSTLMNLSGRSISAPAQENYCTLNGFMTQLFVISTDYWVLIIAICTFLMLSGHDKTSAAIQRYSLLLFTAPWFFSAIWAGLGLGLVGYGNIGAWCWFTSDKVRLYVNFIPRWVIVAIILALYLRLYFIVRQTHKRFQEVSSDAHPSSERGSEHIGLRRNTLSYPIEMSARTPPATSEGSESCKSAASDDYGQLSISQDPEVPAERQETKLAFSSSKLRKISYKMMTYPLVYMLIWIIPTSLRIYQSVTGQPAPFAIATVDKACIVIQGFADAIVYGISESTLGAWRKKFLSRR